MSEDPKIGENRRGNAGKGRPKGSVNKATADVKAAAQKYTDEAMDELARIMRESESDAARVSAIKEIFDRGHGKPKQSLDVAGNLEVQYRIVERRIVRPSDPNG